MSNQIPKCGPGSTEGNTKVIRKFLWDISKKYDIKSICDLGCGDLFWYSLENYPFEYHGYDQNIRSEAKKNLKENMYLYEGDIRHCETKECDLAMCKDVLRHHNDDDIGKILKNIRCKYLLADYDIVHKGNVSYHEKQDGNVLYGFPANEVDVRRWLGDPIYSVESQEKETKRFGVWILK